MRVALVSMVLVGLILHAAHAAQPEKPTVSLSVAPAVAEAEVDAAINAGELLGGSKMQQANPYTRGCNEITLCRD
uniref:Uncharacterized protein n=1 Tax=Oryza punctata TaxID=4537 RepID=A0A0E0JED1_ORYPU